MRRRPKETPDFSDTRVFPTTDWEQGDVQYLAQEEIVDLSSYAAIEIPEGKQHGARTYRYAPSPHSSQYEESSNSTNSQDDPFSHSSHDNRQKLIPQNRHVDEMPLPTRKSQLNTHIPSIPTETFITPTPQAPAPAPHIPEAFTLPVATEDVPTNTVEDIAVHNEPIVENTYEPAPVLDEIVLDEINIEELEAEELSDFEEEFFAAQAEETEVLIDEPEVAPSVNSAWSSPVDSGFEAIAHPIPSDLFAPRHESETNVDDFYDDLREPGQTVQLDKVFFSGLVKKVIANKILLVVVLVLVLAFTALLIINPGSSSETPTDISVISPAPQDSGTIIKYDVNGEPVYSNGFSN